MAREQFVLFIFICCLSSRFADAYDPVDPNGNITINWDFPSIEPNVYAVKVSIHNYQLYRHIERPGWRLSWVWAGHEFISDVIGAETTERGNCTLLREATGHGGPAAGRAVQQAVRQLLPWRRALVRHAEQQDGHLAVRDVHSQFRARRARRPQDADHLQHRRAGLHLQQRHQRAGDEVQGRRAAPRTRTWQIICSYSQFRDAPSPSCCVSLTTFYNNTIVGCPRDSCGGANSPSAHQCLSGGEQSKVLAALPDADGAPPVPVIRCTEHMCPIRVHWHVKQSYRGYWRVKTTVTNYDVVSNYTDWNLVVQHPNLRSLTQLFSFNYQPLIQYGTINDTGVFWGIKNYNEMLLRDGNVQTEMILEKDPSDFTFSGGWAFPRRVYFNGHECVMPPPDQYPSLPNAAWDVRVSAVQRWLVAGSCLLSLSMLFLV
ncbi:hypothetical protein CFC21_024666 [Triticum aestivum]|uniref:COBRA-like protein n=2 Tax=Triticum aestivum TaxID=4565 RepID=A0A9R1JAQ4_WHEAT|nr:hypothetical protein CFC21_024666 [Triticum aestivum]